MNKKKSLITALLLVVVAGLSIVAGTFAYFQWTTGAEGGTAVNVTIEMGGITMHIEPETTEFVGLYPTAHCENNVRYGDALVTIVNNTGTLALPSFKLKVKVTDKDGNGVPADALSHIHYSVVPIETTKSGDNPVKGETTYTCANIPSVNSTDTGGLLTNGEGSVTSSFTFAGVATDGTYTHVPSVDDVSSSGVATTAGYLPRQYFISGDKLGETAGITYIGNTYTTTYQYYRVYVWIDDGYTSTIVGNVVSDPLQNAKIEITWSEESMVQQVSGESNNVEEVLAAGYYDNEGNMVKTWQQLLDDEDIAVSDTILTNSNRNLTDDLVIDNSIIEIGRYAFGGYWSTDELAIVDQSKLKSITLPSGLVSIGEGAFEYSSITSIKIPSGVTYIGYGAFSASSLSSITFSPNSQLTTIEDRAFEYSNISSIEIPASVEEIGYEAFYDSSLSSITFAPNSQLTAIQTESFSFTSITSIEIPASVILIGPYAFDSCNELVEIKYKGTVEAWNAINKGEGWNRGVPATKVICSDGEVSIK